MDLIAFHWIWPVLFCKSALALFQSCSGGAGASNQTLIWIDSFLGVNYTSTYYDLNTFSTKCCFRKQESLLSPLATVTLNGTAVVFRVASALEEVEQDDGIWAIAVAVNFQPTGPGSYRVQCTDSAGIDLAAAGLVHLELIVEKVIAPYFDPPYESVTYEDGSVNRSLVCSPLGAPEPGNVTWSWDQDETLWNHQCGFHENTSTTLQLPRMSLWYDLAVVNCTVTNDFGQIATKSFTLHVTSTEPSVSTLSIVAFAAAGLFALCAVGVCFKYKIHGRRKRERVLTVGEVKEFFEGRSESPYTVGGNLSVPYDRSLEIPPADLHIDRHTLLGEGQHGVVFRGKIKDGTQLAVKAVRRNASHENLKALMIELKLLASIGRHPNIVNLIGACTSGLAKGELFVAVELYWISLDMYLDRNRSAFGSGSAIHDTRNAEHCGVKFALDETSLARWSAEIAEGMEFISSKRVIHGDLATRNILLSFDMVTKIGDFGLARMLHRGQYTYVKSGMGDCQIPWAWSAIEILEDGMYTTKSDVWAYGVTLWEMFSLGNSPYEGRMFSPSFLDDLRCGLRLSKPEFANHSIYSIMSGCWNEDPKARPNFSELKDFFNTQLPTSPAPSTSPRFGESDSRDNRNTPPISPIQVDIHSGQ